MNGEPRIGVGVIIVRDGEVLLGLRRGAHGAGCWQFPGGHLRAGEGIEQCAVREAWEETGLKLRNLRLGPYTNDIFAAEGRHYVTLFVLAGCEEGAPEVKEPEKCEQWRWCRWGAMPTPLFLPIRNLLRQGYVPAECVER